MKDWLEANTITIGELCAEAITTSTIAAAAVTSARITAKPAPPADAPETEA